jgi:hypothetical protein
MPFQIAEQIDSSKIIVNNHNKYLSENVMRFSLASVQLKFSAIMEASGGLTVPADGMKLLPEKKLLPRNMLNVIDKQIYKVATNTLRLL